MLLSGSMGSSTMAVNFASCNVRHKTLLPSLTRGNSPANALGPSVSFPKLKILSVARQERNIFVSRGMSTEHLLHTSKLLFGGDLFSSPKTLPLFPFNCKVQPRSLSVPRASKSFIYPLMESKPRWWWRTLACVPYLLPISDTLVYAEVGFHLKNLLEQIGFLTNPLTDTFALLPSWSMLIFSYIAYLWIIRRKEWPHFLRFHLVMAMLLSSTVQIAGVASGWFPRLLYQGDMQSYFWMTCVFVQLFTVLECIRSALRGMYADVPFVSDAAYMHASEA